MFKQSIYCSCRRRIHTSSTTWMKFGADLGNQRGPATGGGSPLDELLKRSNSVAGNGWDNKDIPQGRSNISTSSRSSSQPSFNRFATQFEKKNARPSRGAAPSASSSKGSGSSLSGVPKLKHGKSDQHQRRHSGPVQPKKPLFQFNSGTEQAKEAVKSVIDAVHTVNGGSYTVKFLDPETKKLNQIHLSKVINDLNLDTQGLMVIPTSNNTEDKTPLVRVTGISQMMKKFSDDKAAVREKKLLEMGSRAANRSFQSRERAEKKKSATKVITISWKISFGDLENQKTREIQKRIEKGENFVIFVGDRYSFNSARRTADKSGGLAREKATESESNEDSTTGHEDNSLYIEESLDAITRARREKIITELKDILAESVGKVEVSGRLDQRIVMTCSNIKLAVKPSASPSKGSSEGSELSPKEQRRLKKLEKQNKKQQKVVSEEDLDSLYQLKL
ncbi:hypothetical protein CAAN3_20S01068 [[Candida] anglica]